MIFNSNSPNETEKIARSIAESAQAGSVFCLTGDLGAGKTVFAKGFAAGLGINEQVTSPTFCILNEYSGRLPFYHFDVYRTSSNLETDDVCFQDYFNGNGVCLIEWAENVKDLLPADSVWITIARDLAKGEDYRIIEIKNGDIL